jgi:hypothetical protein
MRRASIKRPRGFGEVFDKRFTIQTPARKRLQFMLQNMPGGSIGIAGSRGAGKTTLIRLFCGPKRVIDKLNEKPVLGVLVSAPVAYEARDFILYLFSTACQNVIEAEGGKYTPPRLPSDAPPTRLEDVRGFVALRPIPFLLIRFGLVLVLVGSLIALGLATLQPSMPVASTTSQSASLPATTSQAPASTGSRDAKQQKEEQSNLGRAEKPPQARQSSGTQSQNTHSASPVTRNDGASLVSRWMSLLKIDPAPLVVWGGTFMIVGLMLAEFLRLGVWRTFLISVARLLHVIVGRIPIYGRLTGAFLSSQRMKGSQEWARRHPRSAEDSIATPLEDSLRGHAETWLKTIKFQQSYTSGWSGSLKLPIGLEGGVNRAVTLAQNQLSLPEIGYFFMQFLEEASLKYQVIIGIDEMDKLASDELAQQFINDIKSIFGLERCFYLISVSENAMSNFERRGLPFRDVFDSAFDDFVYVDHLNFESAKELLEQRIVGRPILFFAMSYCMSGGLARDLIRNFRSVLEAHEQDKDHNSLTAICRKVVESDLLAKVRATRTSAKKIELEPEVDQFLVSLYALEVGVDSDDLLVKAASALLTMTSAQESGAKPVQAPIAARTRHGMNEPSLPGGRSTNDQQTTSEDKDRVSKAAELRDLAEELATYIYYAVTLRQLFNDELKETALTKPPLNGNLDALAKARQVLGVNPAITRALLRSFRDAHGLAALP